jgi:hypothetical protein
MESGPHLVEDLWALLLRHLPVQREELKVLGDGFGFLQNGQCLSVDTSME